MNPNTLPKYIPDTPHGDDFFKIHSQIAEMLYNTISDSNVKDNSFTLGLLGTWGSGKSLTINCLKKKIQPKDNILFFEFDVWKYVDSSLYRSILIDFERSLTKKANQNLVSEAYKEGIRTTEGKNLHDVLYKSTQESSPKLRHENDWCSKISHKWKNKSKLHKAGEFFLITPLCLLITTSKYIYTRSKLFWLLLGLGVLFSFAYYYKSNIESLLPFLSDAYLKPIFKFLAFSVIGLSGIELVKESLKDFFKEMLPKTTHNVVITSPPTFAQDQFEDIFREVINNISNGGQTKVVIVFDNVDRCESKVTIQILTGLKTFLDHKNCFYLIPCDDQRIKDHIHKKKEEEEDYLDKIFQACIRIPAIEGGDKLTFIKKCLDLAEFQLDNKYDEDKLTQILTLAYKADTPRQIKRFFNDFISYYRLASIIDPKKELILKDIGYFTLMVAIKQKWPTIESSMLENSNFFKEFDTIKEKEKYDKEAIQFIDICLSWVDHTQDPASFIFLKNSNNSYNRVERILIQGQMEFEITPSLIQQIEKYISTLRNDKQFILFEASIESLKTIIEVRADKIDDYLITLLFKIYFKLIIYHRQFKNESKKETYFLSHSKFISKSVDIIDKLDLNNIPIIQDNISLVIRENPARAESLELYDSIVVKFPSNKIELIFKNLTYVEFQGFNRYLTSTKKDIIQNVFPKQTLETIANSLDFNRNEENFVNFISLIRDKQGMEATLFIISRKLYEAMNPIQGHPGIHPSDQFIIKGLSILDKDFWDEGIRETFNQNLNQRLNVLFQHGQIDLASNYAIEGIRSAFNTIINFFQPNGQHFDIQAHFNNFINRIDSSALIIGMQNSLLSNQLMRISAAHNLQSKIIDKLNTEFIITNLDLLILDNLNWCGELFKQNIQRRAKGEDSQKLDLLEKNLIEKYSTYPNILFNQFLIILPQITNEINRDIFAEKTVEFLRTNHKNNAEDIARVISLLTTNFENVMSKIYNNSKMQLVEIDNNSLFSALLGKLSIREKDDYLSRVLLKISNDLKTPGQTKEILTSIHTTASVHDLQNKQRLVVDIITELFEPSRDEVDNTIGIELLKILKGDNNKRTFDLDKSITSLLESPLKTEELKTKLKAILN